MMLRVTRDVAADEDGNHLGREVKAGELLYRYDGPKFGVISEAGVAVQEILGGLSDGPFAEFPADAVEVSAWRR